jgi:hypothetical protein
VIDYLERMAKESVAAYLKVSLETLWLKNIRTMDRVQITDRSTLKQFSSNFSGATEENNEIPQLGKPVFGHRF